MEQFDINNEGLTYSLPFDGKHLRYFYDCDMDETIPESGRCEAPLHVLKQSLMLPPSTPASGVWLVDKKSGVCHPLGYDVTTLEHPIRCFTPSPMSEEPGPVRCLATELRPHRRRN